jgi:hypothetical protein
MIEYVCDGCGQPIDATSETSFRVEATVLGAGDPEPISVETTTYHLHNTQACLDQWKLVLWTPPVLVTNYADSGLSHPPPPDNG